MDLAPRTELGPSPFTMLSTLSSSNPKLQKLALKLNYSTQFRGWKDLPPAPTELLLSSTFPHLTEFSLKGFLEPPPPTILSTFLASHPKLRSLTCHLSVKIPVLRPGLFPNLKYFEGSALVLAAICEVSESPRNKLTKVRVDAQNDEAMMIHMLQAFPKLPNLVDLHLRFVHTEEATPYFMKVLGESCPGLRKLSLQDPEWVGEQVSVLDHLYD